jgi:hypothetical protein
MLKMKNMLIALGLGAAVIGATAPALAQVNARQLNQERRIDAGQRSGKLTHAEAARLDAQQRSIRQLEARLRARHGGHLTAADKRLIHARQQQADRAILTAKQNRAHGRNHLKI